MRVLQISGTDKIGGAGIATYRLHEGLRQLNIDSTMLVSRKATSDPTVHRLLSHMNRWQRLQLRYTSRRYNTQLKEHPRRADSAYWSLNHINYPIADIINTLQADIVHIHWIGDNYLPIQQLAKINTPIMWTLHDMWAFTGGCHYAGDCIAYQTGCGNCPQLVHSRPNDISRQIFRRKKQAWVDLPMTIICPSRWLADCARNSAILANKKIEVIPNGIDTTQFKPINKTTARHALNLPQDKKLVLFGAFGGTDDPRKGFVYLRDALGLLSDVELVVFGADQPQDLEVNLPAHQIGRLQDIVSMTLLYSACDVFVLPSLQDNLPNTILEALACGTPCVAFDTGGIADLIQHQQNGYLAKFKDVNDLAHGIQSTLDQVLSSETIYQQIVERYHITHIAEQYRQLYEQYVTLSDQSEQT